MDSIESQTLKMEEENIDDQEVIETPESVEETVETPEESVEEKIARLEQEKSELEDKNKKLYARVKKEEKPKEVQHEQSKGLSTSDIIALSRVHEDDVERVERYAKSEGLSVKEALKNPELKAILEMREEQRTTANASNVSNVRRGSTKLSDDVLISNASNGKIPENDDDIARLIQAKMKQKD